MIIGAIVLTILGIITTFIQTNISFFFLAFTHEDIGGYEGLITKYFDATASLRANASQDGTDLCGGVPDDAMHLLRDATPGYHIFLLELCQAQFQ